MIRPGCTGCFQSSSRREFLKNFSLGFGSLALGELLHRDGYATSEGIANPLAPRVAGFRPQAKNIIFLFMQGGPSQLETFDPKPQMGKYDGQLLPESFRKFDLAQINTLDAKVLAPIFPFRQYGESGMEISNLFPNLATHADKLAVIRSCYHDLFIHGSAITLMNSGTQLLGHPSVGAWVSYGLGTENDSLPAYVVMSDTSVRNGASTYGSGFLPAVNQGTLLKLKGSPILNLQPHPSLSDSGQRRILDLVHQWNLRHCQSRPGDSRLDARISNYELAYRMQTAAPDLIDLSKETQATRDLYGTDQEPTQNFGKMCLLGRRMVERGIRYVHLINGDWDAHSDCKGNHQKQADVVDRPIAGLLTDLEQRGLLDNTLVVWIGEFGRTPIAQHGSGRDHHPYGFSAWMAGGGIHGGKVIGTTDDFGFHAIDDKVHVNDLHATMLSLLGVDHEKLTYLFQGRENRLTDVGGYNDLSSRLAS